MSEYVCRTDEVLADHPFTDPARTGDDLAVMARIAAALCAVVASSDARALEHYPGIIYRHDADGNHRFVINHMREMRTRTQFTLVGFFGHRHRELNGRDLDEADALLLGELRAHAGMLAYCSYQYCADQYGNLVVFADAEAQAHWSRSEHHAHIAATISPRYYDHIRLHNGVLTGALTGPSGDTPAITIHKSKYFDYRNGSAPGMPWRGVRVYAPVYNP